MAFVFIFTNLSNPALICIGVSWISSNVNLSSKGNTKSTWEPQRIKLNLSFWVHKSPCCLKGAITFTSSSAICIK